MKMISINASFVQSIWALPRSAAVLSRSMPASSSSVETFPHAFHDETAAAGTATLRLDAPKSIRGISLIEMLVYMSVLIVIVGVGYTALYRCLDNSNALRRSADDIANALHTGEDWRADVRAADGKIQLESLPDEQILHLPGSRGEVSYRFAANAISRRLGNNEWSPLLANVQTSTFVADTRTKANAWRWEIELQTRTKKFGTVKPLFTFIAVPAGELPK